jgi:N6-adenosine-specific RNA methylase IME4
MSAAQSWLFEEQAPRFRTILMDPPWPERGGDRGAQNHYPLVPVERMPGLVRSSGLFLPYPDGSHLWLWVTNNYLPAGLWLMQELGFRYVSNVAWVKPGAGIGQYLRGAHELLLFGVLGEGMSPGVLTGRKDLSTVLVADWEREEGRKVHSAKPHDSYELVEARSKGPYLELFARGAPRSAEWTVWGNQAQPDEGRTP